MRDVDAISLAGIAYAIIVTIVAAIFFRPYVTWPILGAATALFNHSLMIRITSNGFSVKKYMIIVVFRFLMYGIICTFLYVLIRDEALSVVITSYVFLFLGFSTIRVGILLHLLPFIHRHTVSYKEEVAAKLKRLEEEKQTHVDQDN